jgi:hypothetical protein
VYACTNQGNTLLARNAKLRQGFLKIFEIFLGDSANQMGASLAGRVDCLKQTVQDRNGFGTRVRSAPPGFCEFFHQEDGPCLSPTKKMALNISRSFHCSPSPLQWLRPDI